MILPRLRRLQVWLVSLFLAHNKYENVFFFLLFWKYLPVPMHYFLSTKLNSYFYYHYSPLLLFFIPFFFFLLLTLFIRWAWNWSLIHRKYWWTYSSLRFWGTGCCSTFWNCLLRRPWASTRNPTRSSTRSQRARRTRWAGPTHRPTSRAAPYSTRYTARRRSWACMPPLWRNIQHQEKRQWTCEIKSHWH